MFAILLAMLRYTALGLEMRAVTQNRHAASWACHLRRRAPFGLGSGIAGIAAWASQIDNVAPIGQSYIIDSFMVVVFGGVGTGTRWSAPSHRHQQVPRPVAGAVLGKIAILVLIILLSEAGRAACSRSRGGGGMCRTPPRSLDRAATTFILVVAGLGIDPAIQPAAAGRLVLPGADLWWRCGEVCLPPSSRFRSIDLGYCGILSLGHGAFFALGGYAMGMYLMRQIGSRGVYGNPILPDFMFLNYPCPGTGTASTCSGSRRSWWCWCRASAFAFGWFAFRSRVTGVSFDHHAGVTYALLSASFVTISASAATTA